MKNPIIILILAAAIWSCGTDQNNNVKELKAVPVLVKVPDVPEGQGRLSASGTIEAEQFANLSTRTMGYVSKVHVKVGDRVKKGELLIDINSEEIDAKMAQAVAGLRQAEAQLSIAEKDLERYEALYLENSASEKEMENITLKHTMALANHQRALQVQKEIQAAMAYSHIRAPFTGVVTSKNVKMGDLANPGQSLMSIETPGEFAATVMVPEVYIDQISQGQPAEVLVKSSGYSIGGIVSEISTSSRNSGGQFLVKILLDSSDDVKLYSGMYVSALFHVAEGMKQNIRIDKSALVERGELQGIYSVSESGTAILRWLKLGEEMGEQVEVLSGLKPGEQYIVSHEGKMYNGVKILVE